MTTTGIRAGANASENRLAIVPETAWGVTPATPGFTLLRLTSENFKPGKTTKRSDEINPNRNVMDEIQVGRQTDGQLSFELSYGLLDDIIESLLFSTWATNVIKIGAGVGQSFTIERKINLSAGPEYQRFGGMVSDELTLNIAADDIIKGTVSMMGKFGGRSGTAISGATYGAANTNAVMSASNQFGTLTATGLGSPAPRLSNLTLSLKNSLRGQRQLGQVDNIGIAPGRCEVTGSFEAYFENGTLFDAYLNHDDVALSFILGSVTAKKYLFALPTIKLTGDPGIETGGNDQDVMAKMNFTAIYDRIGASATSLQITRAVA